MDVKPPQQPVMDIQPPRQPVSDIKHAPAVNPAPVPDQTTVQAEPATLAAASSPKKHSRTPFLAIGLAVALAIVFGTFAVMAYLNADESKSPSATEQTTAQPAIQKVAPAAVDDTNAAVDQSLQSVDDNADYDTNSLSDTTLGL